VRPASRPADGCGVCSASPWHKRTRHAGTQRRWAAELRSGAKQLAARPYLVEQADAWRLAHHRRRPRERRRRRNEPDRTVTAHIPAHPLALCAHRPRGHGTDGRVRDRRPLHGTARLAGLRVYASSRGLCCVSGLRVAQPRPSNFCHPRAFTQRGLGTEAANCSPRAQERSTTDPS